MTQSIAETITQGVTYDDLTITCKDAAGDPLDLTGYTVRSQIRKYISSDDVILDLDDGGYISISDAVNGVIAVDIPDEITAGLPQGSAACDVLLEDPSGDVERLLFINFTIGGVVTRG